MDLDSSAVGSGTVSRRHTSWCQHAGHSNTLRATSCHAQALLLQLHTCTNHRWHTLSAVYSPVWLSAPVKIMSKNTLVPLAIALTLST